VVRLPRSHAAVVFGSSRILPPIFIAGRRPLLTNSYTDTLLRLSSFASSGTVRALRRVAMVCARVAVPVSSG
jgi:hypothetical protein